MFYVGNKQFKSDTVFTTCQDSCHPVLHPIGDIERLFHSVHRDPSTPVQEAGGKSSGYIVTAEDDIAL